MRPKEKRSFAVKYFDLLVCSVTMTDLIRSCLPCFSVATARSCFCFGVYSVCYMFCCCCML